MACYANLIFLAVPIISSHFKLTMPLLYKLFWEVSQGFYPGVITPSAEMQILRIKLNKKAPIVNQYLFIINLLIS